MTAGASYPMSIAYTGGSTLRFKCDDIVRITLPAIPVQFNAPLSKIRWGSFIAGDEQDDAVFQ